MKIIKKIFRTEDNRSVRERIAYPLARLQAQQKRTEQISMQLQRRDHDLFSRCVEAQRSGDRLRAHMYADECAEIRRIARMVLASQLVLEKVVVRLETLIQVGDIVGRDLAPVVGLLREMGGTMSGLIPSIASELESINSALTGITTEIGRADTTYMTEAIKEDAKNVLTEATAMAELKMKEQYVQLPQLEPQPIVERKSIPKADTTSLEARIYQYAIAQADRFNIAKCAHTLGVTRSQVERCLEKLVEEGRIALERE